MRLQRAVRKHKIELRATGERRETVRKMQRRGTIKEQPGCVIRVDGDVGIPQRGLAGHEESETPSKICLERFHSFRFIVDGKVYVCSFAQIVSYLV